MFANLALVFLEFTCRLCKSDPKQKALPEFSKRLNSIDKRYFIQIPGLSIPSPRGFNLPHVDASHANDLLICALFDLVRNGLSHQYQQMLVRLRGGKNWGITLTGAARGKYLELIDSSPRSKSNHLRLKRVSNGDVWLTVNPARLFLDFKHAFDGAKLLKKKLVVNPLVRPNRTHSNYVYNFNSVTLESLFQVGEKGGFRK